MFSPLFNCPKINPSNQRTITQKIVGRLIRSDARTGCRKTHLMIDMRMKLWKNWYKSNDKRAHKRAQTDRACIIDSWWPIHTTRVVKHAGLWCQQLKSGSVEQSACYVHKGRLLNFFSSLPPAAGVNILWPGFVHVFLGSPARHCAHRDTMKTAEMRNYFSRNTVTWKTSTYVTAWCKKLRIKNKILRFLFTLLGVLTSSYL